MIVGAIENPVTNITAANAGRLATTKNSETPTARSATPSANRFHRGESQWRSP
ncbi:hypothetical protein GALL_387580 [mine drainage metagenome]|uniref:Uncharacterized protein n=1 Tax=mine drainage metagenome TaxID=410659 RepID=A0A1J5QUD6_9ZZZZ